MEGQLSNNQHFLPCSGILLEGSEDGKSAESPGREGGRLVCPLGHCRLNPFGLGWQCQLPGGKWETSELLSLAIPVMLSL